MLLISALALGLIETTNSNLGTTSYLGGFGYAAMAAAATASAAAATSSVESVIAGDEAGINSETVIDRGGVVGAAMPSTSAGSVHSNSLSGNGPGHGPGGGGVTAKDVASIVKNTDIVGSSASNGGTITWDNNGTLRSASPGDWSIGQCLIWQRPHHLYFQLGNAFFFLAFLGPRHPFGALWMRAFLVIGCVLMGMYGYMIECTPDVVLWSGLFLAINSIYLIVVLCRLRPVRFEKEIEAIVCDADCKILDIVARTRGSVHDARIWSMCRLKKNLEATQHEKRGILLGDGGYPASSIMLTPVRNPLTIKEQRYNRSHITTRAKIECLNGQLKYKFQSVLERIRVDLNTAKNIIVAVAILHNIAKERNLPFFDFETNSEEPIFRQNLSVDISERDSGRAFKAAFINRHF